jgi:hypothetical protein
MEDRMMHRRVRDLALTGTTIVSATLLAVLAVTGASAAVTGAASPGRATVTTVASALRPAAALPPGTFLGEIANYHAHGSCVGISGNNFNAPAVQWPCPADEQQSWVVGSSNSAGYYQIEWTPGQCLGVAGGSTAPGTRVVGWDCGGPSHPDQYWLIFTNVWCTVDGVQYYPIVNYKSGLVLGVAGNSTATGAHIVIWTYQGVCNNQFWAK